MSSEVHFFKVGMPYCLERQPDGTYLVLNRQYQLLGSPARGRRHEQVQGLSILRLDAGEAAALAWNASDDLSRIYLYADGCLPTLSGEHMAAYLGRLQRLSRLKVRLAGG